VCDPDTPQDIIKCSAILSGDDYNTFYGYIRGTITYSGLYPRITAINLDGDTTISNREVAVIDCLAADLGDGRWSVTVTFMEKTQ
jgi:hypothetical protein